MARNSYPYQSKQDIINVIRKLAKELGRSPSQADMRKAGVPWHRIYNLFGGMRPAVIEAGLEPGPRGEALNEGAMILDWAGVVRKMRRLPSRGEYDRLGKHHSGTLHARLEWSQMAHRFVLMAREFHLETEWEDVLAIVVKRFPLLGRSSQPSAVSKQPDSKTLLLMNTDDADQRAGRETQTGMAEMQTAVTDKQTAMAEAQSGEDDTPAWLRARGLRKVASGALALQMLIAMASGEAATTSSHLAAGQNSTQPPAVSTQLPQHAERQCLPAGPAQALNGVAGDHAAEGIGEIRGEAVEGVRIAGTSREPADKDPVVYGAPLTLAAMAHAPTNEGGVLFLFGVLAERLGFRIERVQAAFPDCEAKREVRPGVWKWVKVELEFESRNFKDHKHDPKGCNVIVCWAHNWPECPRGIEVIELSRYV